MKLVCGFWILFAALFPFCGMAASATEQDKADCSRGAPEAKVQGCNALLQDPRLTSRGKAAAYANRATAHVTNKDYRKALADLNEAIRYDPGEAKLYGFRGNVHARLSNYDLALADLEECIRRGFDDHKVRTDRGMVFGKKEDYARAIAEFDKALQFNTSYGPAYGNRGDMYGQKGEHDKAISDYETAIRLGVRTAGLYHNLASAFRAKQKYDRAISNFEEAIRLDPNYAAAYNSRGEVRESQGLRNEALADYKRALGLPAQPGNSSYERAIARARANYARLSASLPKPEPAAPVIKAPDRRVALVIGNSDYKHVGRLKNPENDARTVAEKLQRLGFAEVREQFNLDLIGLNRELRRFGDIAVDADWALIYFAGHGMEVNGSNYLIPVDAELTSDRHINDEALPLSRVLEKAAAARLLRLVILDACRNNPFIARMKRSPQVTRSLASGLARLEDTAGVLVAYAARDGTVALDGANENSPFAEALVRHLDEPVEINIMFRRVRDTVLARTNKQQEPWTYGSLPAQEFCFAGCRN